MIKKYFCLLLIIFILSILLFPVEKSDVFPVIEYPEKLVSIGSFTRRHLNILIYCVHFYSLPPAELKQKLLAKYKKNTFTIDELSWFLLNEDNGIPVQLKMIPLTSLKNYFFEKNNMLATLKRAGYKIDNQFTSLDKCMPQKDMDLYFIYLLGKNPFQLGDFYRYRTTDDTYIFSYYNQSSSIVYKPNPENKKAKSGYIKLSKPYLVKGIISTFISQKNCKASLKDSLPAALLKEFTEHLINSNIKIVQN